MLMPFLVLVGFLLGLKCVIATQLLILALVAVILGFAFNTLGDLGIALAVWLVILLGFGMLIGDAWYYHSYYTGTATLGDFFGWFLRP